MCLQETAFPHYFQNPYKYADWNFIITQTHAKKSDGTQVVEELNRRGNHTPE